MARRPRIRRPGERLWMVVASLIATTALMCTVAALIARQLTWAWRPTVVLAALAHQLMWAAPVAILLFVVARRGLGLILAVVAAGFTGWSQLPIYGDVIGTEGTRYNVLQANLRVGHADPDAVTHLVRTRHISIAMTDELTQAELDRLVAAGLPDLLPYRFTMPGPGASGIGIWSRYPLRAVRSYPEVDFGLVSAEVTLAGESVTLVAAHPVPPYPDPAPEWAAELRQLDNILRTHAERLIVGGDFNATWDNPQYRRLLRGNLSDAGNQSGAGYVPTYPTDRWFGPVIAIDHVLVQGITATHVTSTSLRGSDHRGIVAELSV